MSGQSREIVYPSRGYVEPETQVEEGLRGPQSQIVAWNGSSWLTAPAEAGLTADAPDRSGAR